MARINTNVSSLIAQQNLNQANQDLRVRLERLSTGLRINRGADDPAGLIISERMRAETEGIGQAIDNAERASNVLATAEASLQEVGDLLKSVESLVLEAANDGAISKEEIEANQLQIDSAVDSISRIANTTTFAGLNLLNGSLDYVTSGVSSSEITDTEIFSANFGTNDRLPVNVEVISSAEKGGLFLSNGASTLSAGVTLEIAGTGGVEVLQFASGTALSAVAFAVNRASDSTGVEAVMTSGNSYASALQFHSAEFGSDEFVSVQKVPGGGDGGSNFATYQELGDATTEAKRDTGEDVSALVNGNLAQGDGTRIKLNTSALKLELNLSESFAQETTSPANETEFTITEGGAKFQLGPAVESAQQVSFGIPSIAANRLGNSSIGFLSSIVSGGTNSVVDGNAEEASKIIEEALTQVSVIRGRLGAFEKNTLQTNVRSLQISLENLTAAESRIRDADFAKETSELNRSQILSNVATSTLATANSQSQNVLSLLQQ